MTELTQQGAIIQLTVDPPSSDAIMLPGEARELSEAERDAR